MSIGHLHSGGHSPESLRHQNDVQIFFVLHYSMVQLSYLLVVQYDNDDVYTCPCEDVKLYSL